MKIDLVDISKIIPYANNPRKNDKAVDVVANSITQFGFQQPIVVDSSNVIIVGHTRYKAAKKLGIKQVPITIADKLTPEQVQAYRLMDNRSNENSKWDDDLLLQELTELLKDDDIQELSYETGFTESELNKLFNEAEPDLEKYLNSNTPKARMGDIWTLGNHRIACGSSNDEKLIAQLMGTDRIDMIWEDPPYGITYRTAGGINRSEVENKLRDHIIANDTLNAAALDNFLLDHIEAINVYVKRGAPIYWCHDIRFNEQFKQVLINNKFHIADTLIWKKNTTSNWLSNYSKFYEPILYGWKEGEHPWYGKGSNPNAIDLDKLENKTQAELIEIIKSFDSNYQEFHKESRKVAALHPTVKPVKLIVYHLINSSKVGDIIYDGFAGSGSTLIACERSSRVARCVELETKFVDVTIARWQDLSGLQAINQNGEKWDDIQPPVSDNAVMEAFFNLPSEVTISE
jgi:DNA modification methylase